MSERARDRRARACEVLLLFGLYAVPLTVPWTVAGAHIAVGIAMAGAIGLGAQSGRWPLGRTPANRAMLAFAAAALLATVSSIDFRSSLVGLKKLLLLPIIPVAAAALSTPKRARWGLRLAIFGMTATAGIAMLRFELLPHASDARLRSTGHYMTFAGQLLLVWPLAAAAAAANRGRGRWAYAIAAAILSAALLLSFTRSAWIGVVLATTVMLLRARPRSALLVLPAMAAALALLPGNYRERALSSFQPSHPFNVDRLRLWRAGIAMWRDHPWTGVGLVDLKPLYLQYRPSAEGQVHGHLHNNWAQIAATLGTLGLAAFAWLMVGCGRIAWAAGRDAPGNELRALGMGAWGAFWGFQAMGLFEWNFGDVEVTIALYSLLGTAAALSAASPRPRLPATAEPLGPAADGLGR